MRRIAFGVALVFMIGSRAAAAEPENWPQYRGALSDGMAAGATLPDRWSPTENVVWETPIPGWGWSSPVVWGDRVFITSAHSDSGDPTPTIGGYPGGRVTRDDVHHFMVYCLDFDTGKVRWKQEAYAGVPTQQRHPRNSYASETPVTDGQRLYVYFGNVGVFCYDLDGNKLWQRELGSYPTRGGWGTGSSPVLHGDRLFIQNDNEQNSYLVALDAGTGEEVWRVPREEKSNWSTPYIWQNDQRTELVTIGTGKIRSYDLDGKLLWELAGTSGLVSLMPMAQHGLLYVGAGYHYGPLYAIRPGATGDISLESGETSNEYIAWSQPKGAGIHPCFVVSDDRLYVLYDAGLLVCWNALTGESIYDRQRLNTGGGRFYASPWAYNGKLFMLNEDGKTYVIKDSADYELLDVCELDDVCWATPAIARGSLFIRTFSKVYRLQETAAQ